MSTQAQNVNIGSGATRIVPPAPYKAPAPPKASNYQKVKSGIGKAYGSGKKLYNGGKGLYTRAREWRRSEVYKSNKKFICASSPEEFAAYVDKVTGRNKNHGQAPSGGQAGGQAAVVGGQPVIQIYNQMPQQGGMTQYEEILMQQALAQMSQAETQRHQATLNAMNQQAQTLEQALYHVQQMRDADAALLTRSYETIEKNFETALKRLSDEARLANDKMMTGILQSYKDNEEKLTLFMQEAAKRSDDQTAKYLESQSKYLEKLESQYKSALQAISEHNAASNKLLENIVYQLTTGKKKSKPRTGYQRKPRATIADVLNEVKDIKKTAESIDEKVGDIAKKED